MYEKSALLGESVGMCYVGRCYKDGVGVTKDANKAREWYTQAIAQGCLKAQEELQTMLE